MSIPGSLTPLFNSGSSAAAAGYQVSRSLRFNSADSAYLSRTPAVAGNRRTWTWAGWVKIASFTRTHFLFGAENTFAAFNANGTSSDCELYLNLRGSSTNYFVSYAPKLRDPSAWYHLVFAVDTTQGTPANILKVYINGVQATAAGGLGQSFPPQNDILSVNNTVAHTICGSYYFDGYLADIHFIDGQALTPSSFTEVSATTGQLIPLAYSGSFGTNGFWLKFSDNSAATAATLGKDYSGNSNNWTPNNLSVTAGAGNDSLVDTPTSYGTPDTGVGGEVRGNYCTWNPVKGSVVGMGPNTYVNFTLSNGNLEFNGNAADNAAQDGTISVSSGKWYWEVTHTNVDDQTYSVATYIRFNSGSPGEGRTSGVAYLKSGNKLVNNSASAYGASWTTNDVIGVALDLDANQITYYKNGASQGAISVTPSGLSTPHVLKANGTGNLIGAANFGQRAFAYQTPGTNRPAATFKALCDTNLGAPLIAKPNTVFDVKLYTGTGSNQSITGLGFSPDFVWLKSRSTGQDNNVFDAVRGPSSNLYALQTNATSAEGQYGTMGSLDASGFSLTGAGGATNASSTTYVAWAWDAGTSTVSNTAGSITSQVRANASAGFSVVTYSTGASSGNQTIGHGLNVTPSLIIHKVYSATSNWWVYHASTTNTVSKYLQLNSTNATADNVLSMWGAALPTSTVFGANVGQLLTTNQSAVAYCFAPVAGYSSFGSYTGNGSADGPFIFTSFRPRFLLFKSAGAGDWVIIDATRDTYNVSGYNLYPNDSVGESFNARLDILSNGFKLRSTFTSTNPSGTSVVYAAFAENPFQYARAR